MIINFNFHSGLVFGIEADPSYSMDEDGVISDTPTPCITVYIGFISIGFIFAKVEDQ